MLTSRNTTTSTYDAEGNVTSSLQENLNGSGVLTFSRTTTSTYDADSELLTQNSTSISDFDGDGIIDNRFTSVLNADGTEVQTEEEDSDDDGIVNERTITTFDVNGNGVSEVIEFDSVFDPGLNAFVDDGIIDSREITTSTYDAVGNLTRIVSQDDSNADGVIDFTFESVFDYTYTFFPSGAIASATTQEDGDLNGFIESRDSYTYDEAGNILTEVFETFDNATGALTRKESNTYTYDEDGDVLTSLREVDSNGDGVLDSRSATETTILDNVFEGSRSKDRFMGTVGDDIMDGGKGNDVLVGMEGDDELIGGRDRDKMTGGEGEDLFIFTNKKDGADKGDKIRDFTEDEDMIGIVGRKFKVKGKEGDLVKDKFITIGSEAESKRTRFIYDDASGLLTYDQNGSGNGKDFVLAKMEKGLSNIDIMIL